MSADHRSRGSGTPDGSATSAAGASEQASPATWLASHPIVGSLIITVLVGFALQATHMIDLEGRVGPVVGWNLPARSVDFGFRMGLGAIAVLGVLPAIFGYSKRRPWFGRYLRHMRLTLGSVRWLTIAVSVLSITIMLLIIVGLGARFDVLRGDADFLVDESRWFLAILTLVPALWEEMAFRGVMLSNLQQRYRPWIAVTISSLLFGSFHISNVLVEDLDQVVMGMLLATVVAIPWGYAVVKTGSLLPAMASHYAMNVGIGLLLAPDMSQSASAAIFGSLTIAYPICTVLGIWLLSKLAHASQRRTRGRLKDSPS
jgi:membrane protease YdiL (CAAX protease family)